ncbi:MAG TPA: isopentenyl-diphosphate Delta-isomerase [Candidatus Polarisedimenticolaceae bacterium]|nr:isopentenyl-diphosphate Delta-isomerase [Candidatus Polarisedimenticolaceae bacterium]
MVERVTLVDGDDRSLGTMEKLQAHAEGRLHRAFSVFVFDGAGRLLLQRRAASKYHSAGLWSNTCCGHPRPGEPVEVAAARRLFEEMGLRTTLRPLFRFLYRAEIGPAMVEHEVDHVLAGRCADLPAPEPSEVQDWRWVTLDALGEEVAREPLAFTAWLRILLGDAGHRRALAEAGEKA